jgi:UDP-N-acetyl-D-glucosamine dehydrogenase
MLRRPPPPAVMIVL